MNKLVLPIAAIAMAVFANHSTALAMPEYDEDFAEDTLGVASASLLATADRQVRICNYTNFKVWVAVAEDSNGQLATRGWWSIANGTCGTFWAQYLFVHKAGDSSVHWNISGNRQRMCLKMNDTFRIYHSDERKVCVDVGGEMVDFARVPPGTGIYEWNLRWYN